MVVVGTSLGGLLGTAMAMMMPGALAGLILNDVGPDVSPDGLKRILSYVGTDAPQPDWPTAVAFLRKLLPKLKLDNDADWLIFAQNTYRAGDDGALHFDWDVALARPWPRSRLRRSTFGSCGGQSRPFPPLPFAAECPISCCPTHSRA